MVSFPLPDPSSSTPDPAPNERADTRERLLDAAETHFAEQGIDASSLRAITAAANANLAAVHYHFGSKEQLLQAVVERRVGPVNEERLRMLDGLETEAGEEGVPLRALIEAMLEPMVHARSALHGPAASFPRLMGRLLTDTGSCGHALIAHQFIEVAARFATALAKTLPQLSMAEIAWRMHFSIGATAFTLVHSNHLNDMWAGMCDGEDPQMIIDRLVPFIAAGFSAPATEIKKEEQ